MKISTILDHIDNGHMALPEFQRGYVWNRDQVRALMYSLYKRYPVGSLLVWATRSEGAEYRGDGPLQAGVVKLLLDGQQRMTSLYGILRGKAPRFFEGNDKAFSGLYFHLESEEFSFFLPSKMKDDPLWIDVTRLMKEGLSPFITALNSVPEYAPKFGEYVDRLNRILSVRDIDLHNEEVTGEEMSVEVVVDIFNRVNSGGTKLSKGDLALAKICADAPHARARMRDALKKWEAAGFFFNLDWLLRNVNTIITGEAKFNALHVVTAKQFDDGLRRAEKAIDALLNIISGRLGLDHNRVFFGRYALPVMTHYLDRRGGQFENAQERDKLLFWYLHSAMWGRFSGSTETVINQDLKLIENLDGGLDRLIEDLKLSRGGLEIVPGHFSGSTRGARFYPVLYLLTRMGEAQDWGTGLPLKANLLGKMNRLDVHHIFPRKVLYKQGYQRGQVNAIANFCFQTNDTNLRIGSRPPKEYFPEIEEKHPGALASQWIPSDRELWKEERYLDFLEERKRLLANAANSFAQSLLQSSVTDESQTTPPEVLVSTLTEPPPPVEIPGSIDSDEEEARLIEVRDWVISQGLPHGELSHELIDPKTNMPVAYLDLAWPKGLQEGLSQPVALLLEGTVETLTKANEYGFRYFTNVKMFKRYVELEILGIG